MRKKKSSNRTGEVSSLHVSRLRSENPFVYQLFTAQTSNFTVRAVGPPLPGGPLALEYSFKQVPPKKIDESNKILKEKPVWALFAPAIRTN